MPVYAQDKTYNRYPDIFPNPHTRIRLSEAPGDPASSYINADPVSAWANALKGERPRVGYVAAQGPTARTVGSFVRMLWEQRTEVVVMLTRLKEGAKEKCEAYFPAGPGQTQVFGHIAVTSLGGEQQRGWRRTALQLQLQGGETRKVVHYWFEDWPDHGVPRDGNRVMQTKPMLDFLASVRAYRAQIKAAAPTVVHCSAGVGRTGAYMAVDMAIDSLAACVSVDIIGFVERMRQQRMALIQHPEQYEWAHAAVTQYIVGGQWQRDQAAAAGPPLAAPRPAPAPTPKGPCGCGCGVVVTEASDRFSPQPGLYVLTACAAAYGAKAGTAKRNPFKQPAPKPAPAPKPRPALAPKPAPPAAACKPALAQNPFKGGAGLSAPTAAAADVIALAQTAYRAADAFKQGAAEATNNPFGEEMAAEPSPEVAETPNPFAVAKEEGQGPKLFSELAPWTTVAGDGTVGRVLGVEADGIYSAELPAGTEAVGAAEVEGPAVVGQDQVWWRVGGGRPTPARRRPTRW